MQKESENTNTRPTKEHRRAEPEQPTASQEPDAVLPLHEEKQRSAPRLRSSARLNSPLEAQQSSSTPLPDSQVPGEGTGVRLHPPPDHALPAAGEEAAKIATRRQRLLALQGELAQLKKTPSMHLLARQRIPRLEAKIKQLVAALQASA
jgi:hypothetical protein